MAKPVPIFVGSVDETGKLWLEARGLFKGYLKSLKNKPVQVVVKALSRSKSRSQLGYLWGVLYPVLAEEFGYADYDLDSLHDGCMRELRGLKPDPNPLKLRETLRDKDHQYVSDYISDLRHWALMEHQIVTPDANQVETKEPRKRAAA
jgi:hypothetical protein